MRDNALPPGLLARLKAVVSVKDALTAFALIVLPGFAIRALWLARFDMSVALAMVQSTPVTTFVYSNFLSIAPVLVMVIGLGLFVYQQLRNPFKWSDRATWVPTAGAYLLAVGLSVPNMLTIDPITGTVPTLLGPLFAYGGTLLAQQTGATRFFAWTVVPVMASLYMFSGAVWQPAENVETTTGLRTLSVLAVQGTDMVAYDAGRRVVERIPMSTVRSRQFCHIGPTGTVGEWVFGPPGLPACVEQGFSMRRAPGVVTLAPVTPAPVSATPAPVLPSPAAPSP